MIGRKLSETINSLLIQGSSFYLILKQLECRLAQWVVLLTRYRSVMRLNPIKGFHCFIVQEFHPNSLVLIGFRNEVERDFYKLICFCHNKTNTHYYKLKQPVNRNPRLSSGIK